MLRAELMVPELFRWTARSISNVIPRAMSWAWQGWIPRGSLSLVVGEPGVGKSLYALELAALVTRGWSALPISSGQSEEVLSAAEDGGANVARSEKTGGRHMDCARDLDNPGGTSLSPRRAWSSLPGSRRDNPTAVGVPGTVVLFDPGDPASILRSRLDAAGADVERVILVERNWRGDSLDEVEEFLQTEAPRPAKRSSRADKDSELRRDLESLEQHVVQLRQAGHDVSLVIIDPIEALLRNSLDKHRLARQLSELANSLNVAIVAVGTTSLTPRAYPGLRLDRKGMAALFDASQTVISVVREPENERRRNILPIKWNLSAAPAGLSFAFADDGTLAWSEVDTPLKLPDEPAQECQPDRTPPKPERSEELERAMTWLKQRLKAGGVPVGMLLSDASEQQISGEALQQASDLLGCISKIARKSGQWVWRMPAQAEGFGDSQNRVPGGAESRDAERANGVHFAAVR